MNISDLNQYAYNFLAALVIAIAALVLSMLARRLINALLAERSPSWKDFLANVFQISVLLGGLALIVQITGMVSAAILLTILTLFTAGASLSASNLISDALATLRILSLGYYHVGDLVTVAGDIHGQVISINAFSTILKTRLRDKVIINNSTIIGEIIQVHTGYVGHELRIYVPVGSDHNREEVMEWLLEVGRAYPHRLAGPDFEPQVFHEHAPECENYTLTVYVEDQFEIRHHYTALSVAAGNKLNAHGVELGEPDYMQNEISGTLKIEEIGGSIHLQMLKGNLTVLRPGATEQR